MESHALCESYRVTAYPEVKGFSFCELGWMVKALNLTTATPCSVFIDFALLGNVATCLCSYRGLGGSLQKLDFPRLIKNRLLISDSAYVQLCC